MKNDEIMRYSEVNKLIDVKIYLIVKINTKKLFLSFISNNYNI